MGLSICENKGCDGVDCVVISGVSTNVSEVPLVEDGGLDTSALCKAFTPGLWKEHDFLTCICGLVVNKFSL